MVTVVGNCSISMLTIFFSFHFKAHICVSSVIMCFLASIVRNFFNMYAHVNSFNV